MERFKNYLEKNRDRFLEELFGLIKIPSISSSPDSKPYMYAAAEYWKQLLLSAIVDWAKIYDTEGHPVVYGERIIDPNLPTVLIYGHMDVMPVDPMDLWDSHPFEPEIRDGKIYARGADDDKGQSFLHIKAFEYLISTGQLFCNVKFLIEGEEEMGSPNLPKFLEENKEMLKADIILVSDTGIIDIDTPAITTGLRGLSYMEVEVTGPNKDLHSGLFGGAVANPINVLTKMLASLTDDTGKITVKGFYDDVEDVDAAERKEMAKAPFDEEAYMKEIGVSALDGENGYSTPERVGIRPSLDINGIWGGYTKKGAKTIIPSKAFAKVSMRLVPSQDNAKISELFEAHFKALAPETVTVKVTPLHGGQGYVSPTDMPAYQAAEKAYMDVFGKNPVPIRSGGSIPIIAAFDTILGIKSILMGFGLESNAIHSPNENFPLEMFDKGIETIVQFYKHYTEK